VTRSERLGLGLVVLLAEPVDRDVGVAWHTSQLPVLRILAIASSELTRFAVSEPTARFALSRAVPPARGLVRVHRRRIQRLAWHEQSLRCVPEWWDSCEMIWGRGATFALFPE
jgi:hypothetical protein